MASFRGTFQEFHHFIGPRIRNAVNSLTQKERLKRKGICEFCQKQATLDSAHVHEKGRRLIIENVLKKHVVEEVVSISDLNELEKEILEAHIPISSTFKFICKQCHSEYDSNGGSPQGNQHMKQRRSVATIRNEEFKKLHKVRAWGDKPSQKNHKIIQAFRTIDKQNGNVLLSDLESACTIETSKHYVGNKVQFNGHIRSMKTDSGHSHGKIFYSQGTEIKIYEVVKNIIEAHFPAL